MSGDTGFADNRDGHTASGRRGAGRRRLKWLSRSSLGARAGRGVGLRSRFLVALLVTSFATLGLAALLLLDPLENSLRKAALTTLKNDLRSSPKASFDRLDLSDLLSPRWRLARRNLEREQQRLAGRLDALVYVLGYPEANGQGRLLLPLSHEGGRAASDPFTDAAQAFRTMLYRRPQSRDGTRTGTASSAVYGVRSVAGTEYASAALPFRNDGLPYVLVVRRSADEIPAAAHAVGTAFLSAAVAGLALALVIGVLLSATLVRGLRRLRQAVLRITREGVAADVRLTGGRDEVGDLARAFAVMQRRLQRQEEARRTFVSTASHELRTPIAALDGRLELLQEELLDDPVDVAEVRELLTRARAQTRRLARLAADLLDLSRLDAGTELRSEPVELVELGRAVIAEFDHAVSQRGIRINLENVAPAAWALGDPGSLAQILRILIDNAIRVSPEDQDITIVVSDGEVARVSVRDCGPGVPEPDRDLIFERFQRGRATSSQGGFGLGLAIGRELATRMGGALLLDDDYSPGASFTLTIPATTPTLAVHSAHRPPDAL